MINKETYKRLTANGERININTNLQLAQVYNRLAELEDKIMDGTLVEIDESLIGEVNYYKQRYGSSESRYLTLVQSSSEALEKGKSQTRKETAREILKALKAKQVICSPEEDNFVYMLDINKLAKQYGVDVE